MHSQSDYGKYKKIMAKCTKKIHKIVVDISLIYGIILLEYKHTIMLFLIIGGKTSMKKKYKAPLAEVLELEIDETICTLPTQSATGDEIFDSDLTGNQ